MTEQALETTPLRVMIYDTTEKTSRLTQFEALVPESLGFELDDIDFQIPVGLTASWVLGGAAYRAMRWVDVCAGFSDWQSALDWIAGLEPGRQISQIQFWGHGSPGRSWMGGKALTARNATGAGDLAPAMRAVADRMTDDGVIWFRNCGVFAGARGHDFARTLATELDVRVAAHTYVIGAWQSGLHTIGPGEKPMWPEDEGIAEGTPEHPIRLRNSVPWAPNTVFMLTSGIPRNW